MERKVIAVKADVASARDMIYDDLGKRRLAYEIQNFQKGRYVMLRFLDDGSNIKGLERALGLEDSIIRFLTVQVSDAVEDVAARKAEAVEEERIRAEKAAERVAREAEEAARQQLEAAEAEKLAAAKPEETADDEPQEASKNAETSASEDAKTTASEDAETSAPVTAEGGAAEAVGAEEVAR